MDTNDRINNIKLHSPKIRKLMSDIPSWLIKGGWMIMVVIFLMIICVVCLLPYPYCNGESILRHIMG